MDNDKKVEGGAVVGAGPVSDELDEGKGAGEQDEAGASSDLAGRRSADQEHGPGRMEVPLRKQRTVQALSQEDEAEAYGQVLRDLAPGLGEDVRDLAFRRLRQRGYKLSTGTVSAVAAIFAKTAYVLIRSNVRDPTDFLRKTIDEAEAWFKRASEGATVAEAEAKKDLS